jgi:hypothetical protein
MEDQVLKMINFDMSMPSSIHFLDLMWTHIQKGEGNDLFNPIQVEPDFEVVVDQLVHECALYFVDLALMVEDMAHFRGSHIAAAALIISLFAHDSINL